MSAITKVYVDPERGHEVQEHDGIVLASHALHDAVAALQDMLQHAPHDPDVDRPAWDAACEKGAAAIAKATGSAA